MHEYRASSPRVLKCPLVWGVAVARGERAFYSPHFFVWLHSYTFLFLSITNIALNRCALFLKLS